MRRTPARTHITETIVLEFEALSLSQPWAQAAFGLAGLLLLAWVVQLLVQLVLTRGVARLGVAAGATGFSAVLLDRAVLRRVAQIAPALLVLLAVRFVPHLPAVVVTVIENVAGALIVLFIARTLFKMLDVALHVHDRHGDAARSIKAYVQMGQLVVAIAAVVIMIAALADKSPLIVLSGFGAMSAVLMLVFQDIIKSFAAGLQIEGNDMLRVGDWIEMPQMGADGAVIDIALHTVKVQNWDKTITTIPTWRLMSESYRNWRGMSESGGRRIKRQLRIDSATVRFLSDADIDRLERIALLAPYLAAKRQAVHSANAALGEGAAVPANLRRLTNIGTFRAYVQAYLQAHPGVHQGMTLMVRMLEPTAEGVPLELYCFTATTAWVQYEAIQGDIFDHLLALLPEFDLRLYQSPTGWDIRSGLQQKGLP